MSFRSTLLGLAAFFTVTFSAQAQQVSFTTDVTEGCDTLTVQFTNTSSLIPHFWGWDFGDGTDTFALGFMPIHPQKTYIGTGVYNVVLFAIDTTGAMGNPQNFTVTDLFQMDITLFGMNGLWVQGENNGTICSDDEIVLNADALGDSITWLLGDGNVAYGESVYHIYGQAGTYNVRAVLYTPCGNDTSSLMLTADDQATPDADFGWDPNTGCPGEEFQFWVADGIDTWDADWDFGDGNTDSDLNPTHEYMAAGTYSVDMTVTNACGKSATQNHGVTISNNAPVRQDVGFFTLPFFESCPGEEIQFIADNSQGSYEYYWNLGDGTLDTGKTVKHTYAGTGFFPIDLHIVNSCGNDTTISGFHEVTSSAQVSLFEGMYGVAEEEDNNLNFAGACPGDSILFFATASGTITWDFGDGNSGTAIEPFQVEDGFEATIIKHAYTTPGLYTATITLTNSCGGTASGTLMVEISNNLPATADFAVEAGPYGEDHVACENLRMIALGGVQFEWDYGDGATATTTAGETHHSFNMDDYYEVWMVATNGCGNTDTAAYGLDILPYPTTVHLSNSNDTLTSALMDQLNSVTYQWYLNGTEIPNATNDSWVATIGGLYHVEITDSGGCQKQSDTIEVTKVGIGPDVLPQHHISLYPNPVLHQATLQFNLLQQQAVQIDLVDMMGRTIRPVVNSTLSSGTYQQLIDTKGLDAGMYLIRMDVGGTVGFVKCSVVR